MVRSRFLFSTSLLLLASAATLAGVLVHDGEVGTDEARLAYAGEGDPVKIKGTLTEVDTQPTAAWQPLMGHFHHATYELTLSGFDATVLVTGLDHDLDANAVIVEGDIVYNGPHPDHDGHLVILDAHLVTEPFFAW